MIKLSRKPYGYRELLAYKKAEELQIACAELTHRFPRTKTLIALADQMDRSARSVKQNIVEGWKRNSSKEYYEFLGFSMGANAELEEDCNDIWKGVYPELLKEREIMGERGEMWSEEKGKMKEKEEKQEKGKMDIEKLKFYPIDPDLPPVVKLKLRCKELNFLLDRLQKSLLAKMENEHSLTQRDKLQLEEQRWKEEKDFGELLLTRYNLKRLQNGQVVEDK